MNQHDVRLGGFSDKDAASFHEMSAYGVISLAIRNAGADGLFSASGECCCDLRMLAPCCEMRPDCTIGARVPDGDHWKIVPAKREG